MHIDMHRHSPLSRAAAAAATESRAFAPAVIAPMLTTVIAALALLASPGAEARGVTCPKPAAAKAPASPATAAKASFIKAKAAPPALDPARELWRFEGVG